MIDSFAPAEVEVQEDNERVRVVRYRFPPNAETGWHTHNRDYLVVPTIGGTLTMIDPDDTRHQSTITAGVASFRKAGVRHNVVNLIDEIVEFVETELLP